ncbi:oligosaccaryltransferase [Colletotrichum salicis]|uniref:Dolichyl-diphosphooligosaccharide--protein glycosyltransferase subunit 4 n=1 Tax=Colletotrichum salicis TaxID=1209931 RepID=A0A135UWA5_9PEZI|nr:oligosaccaryltransferase [Colletotrichum salicis]
MSTKRSVGSAQIDVTQKVITANPRRVGAPWMKSEVKARWAGHVKGSHWWGRSVTAELDRGGCGTKVEDRLKHQVTPSVAGLSVDSSSSGLVVRLVAHRHPHLKLHKSFPKDPHRTVAQKHHRANDPEPIMISDNDLYRLAIFLGSAAMVLIIFYHYVEVNTEEDKPEKAVRSAKSAKAVS